MATSNTLSALAQGCITTVRPMAPGLIPLLRDTILWMVGFRVMIWLLSGMLEYQGSAAAPRFQLGSRGFQLGSSWLPLQMAAVKKSPWNRTPPNLRRLHPLQMGAFQKLRQPPGHLRSLRRQAQLSSLKVVLRMSPWNHWNQQMMLCRRLSPDKMSPRWMSGRRLMRPQWSRLPPQTPSWLTLGMVAELLVHSGSTLHRATVIVRTHPTETSFHLKEQSRMFAVVSVRCVDTGASKGAKGATFVLEWPPALEVLSSAPTAAPFAFGSCGGEISSTTMAATGPWAAHSMVMRRCFPAGVHDSLQLLTGADMYYASVAEGESEANGSKLYQEESSDEGECDGLLTEKHNRWLAD